MAPKSIVHPQPPAYQSLELLSCLFISSLYPPQVFWHLFFFIFLLCKGDRSRASFKVNGKAAFSPAHFAVHACHSSASPSLLTLPKSLPVLVIILSVIHPCLPLFFIPHPYLYVFRASTLIFNAFTVFGSLLKPEQTGEHTGFNTGFNDRKESMKEQVLDKKETGLIILASPSCLPLFHQIQSDAVMSRVHFSFDYLSESLSVRGR